MASRSLAITFDVLSRSTNGAAADVLLLALDSPRDEISERALEALLERRDQPYQLEILARWESASERLRAIIARHPGRLTLALGRAIGGERADLFDSACEVVLATRDYDLAPALIAACEQGGPRQRAAGETLLALVDLLHDEWLEGGGDDARRNPGLVRAHVLFALEKSLDRFGAHRAKAPVEAFLTLADRGHEALRTLLTNPRRAAHRAVVEALTTSSRAGVVRLLMSLFADPLAPAATAHVLACRDDEPFVRRLLQTIGGDPSPAARVHLKRMESIRWLDRRPELFAPMSDDEQVAAVAMIVASGMSRLKALDLLSVAFEVCQPPARRAAAAALAEFTGAQANQFVVDRLDDGDPQVQTILVSQLRERGISAALPLLLERVDSPFPEVRQAAAESLAEFHFPRYLAAFDTLTEEARQSTGALVRKIDAGAIVGLAQELASASRTRRLRAMEIIPYLHAAGELADALRKLVVSDDPMVRAAAASALENASAGACRPAPVVFDLPTSQPLNIRDTV